MSKMTFAARGVALLAVVFLGCDGNGGEAPPQPPKTLKTSTQRKALSGSGSACDSALEPRLVVTPSDEAPRPGVRLEGQGLACGETYALVITRPDGTSSSESLTANTQGKVQSTSSAGARPGSAEARLYDSSGDEVANTLYLEPVFRYGHLTWRPVGPLTAEFSVVNAFRRVYWGSGPDGFVVTGDTFVDYAGSTTLCFGDGTCTYPLTYEVTDHDAEEGWVLARAIVPGGLRVLPGTGVTVTESEPNDGINTTDSMQLGDDYSSNIGVVYDRDYVRFTLTERTALDVSTVLQGLRDSYLYLFDSDGYYLASDDDSGGGLASRISITLDAGTYYIGAAAFSSGTGQQLVRLRRVAIQPSGPITHTYFWNAPFTASLSGCCRIEGLDNVVNSWDSSYLVQTRVGFIHANSAPVSSLPPVIEAPANTPDFSFQIPATDAEGDALTFRLATGSESNIAEPPPGLTVSDTGLVSWNTVGTVRGQRWVVQVIIEEHRDGEPIGSSAVDFLLETTGDLGTAPTCLPPSQARYTVRAGESVRFTVGAQDADALDLLTLSASNIPWGAFLQPGLPYQGRSGISTEFSWTTSPWDADATYPMSFTVTDSTGQQGQCSVTVTVQSVSNWPPVVDAGSDQWVSEGQTVTLTGSGYDSDGGPLTYRWSVVSATGPSVTLSSPDSPTTTFRAMDDGAYTFQFTVTDSEGASGSDSVFVRIVNRDPEVIATGGELDEGEVFTSTGFITDPGADSWTATVSYGDDTDVQPLALDNGSFTLSHRYSNNAPWTFYWVRITVTDDDGGWSDLYVPVQVHNVAPTITAHPTHITVEQGQAAVVPITFTDPGEDYWYAFMDYGDGYTDWVWLSSQEFILQHTYYEPGTYSLRLTVMDGDGGQHEVTIPVVVPNVAPVISLQGGTSEEGAYFMSPGSFTDGGGWSYGYTATVDYGDGSGVQPLYFNYWDNTFYLAHIYAENGTYQVTVTVTDPWGATGQATASVVVQNVAPRVYLEDLYYGAFEGDSVYLWAYIDDEGVQDQWTATVDFGDGTGPQPVPVTDNFLTLSHHFPDNGSYTVTLTARDDDGGVGTATTTVVVYNLAPWPSIAYATGDEGSTYTTTGSIVDPGADTWTARVDYGDGSGWQPLELNGTSFALSHVYARSGTYAVQVVVEDDDGGVGSDVGYAIIWNVEPTVTVTGGTLNEGSTFTGSGSFTDPGDENGWSATVDYGDGSSTQALPLNGRDFSLSHVYRDNRSYTVTIQVFDGEGTGTGTAQVLVLNVAPTVTATAGTADEGAPLTLTASVSDPSARDTVVALINYGDGSAVERRSLDTSRSFTLSHRFLDSGTFQVTITVTDDDGGTGTTTLPVQVRNVAPTMVAFLSSGTTSEGSLYTGRGQFQEPGADAVTITVDFGDGSAPQRFLPNTSPSSSTFNAPHVYANSGTYQVTVTLTDDDGGTSTFTAQATILNVTPAVSVTGGTGDEGSAFIASGSFTDPGTEPGWSASADYGDGSGWQPLAVNGRSFTLSHVYADNGSYTVSVRVSDDVGTGTATAQVSILNVAPTVTASNDSPAYWGMPVHLAGSATDPSPADTAAGFTSLWTLGDGATVAGLTTAHAYAAPGVYPARLRVTDKDGADNTLPAVTMVTIQQRPGGVTCADATAVFGFPVALDASFVDGLAGGLPGGRSLTFRLGDSTGLGSATTDATGLASVWSPGLLVPGSHSFTVSFEGDSHYAAAEAHCTLTVLQSNGHVTGGGLGFAKRARGGFNVKREADGPVQGELQFQNDDTAFHAHELTALGISADKRQAWFAGVGRDGRAFTAYVEDNGEPGTADVFKLWIDGVQHTEDGTLSGGNIQIH